MPRGVVTRGWLACRLMKYDRCTHADTATRRRTLYNHELARRKRRLSQFSPTHRVQATTLPAVGPARRRRPGWGSLADVVGAASAPTPSGAPVPPSYSLGKRERSVRMLLNNMERDPLAQQLNTGAPLDTDSRRGSIGPDLARLGMGSFASRTPTAMTPATPSPSARRLHDMTPTWSKQRPRHSRNAGPASSRLALVMSSVASLLPPTLEASPQVLDEAEAPSSQLPEHGRDSRGDSDANRGATRGAEDDGDAESDDGSTGAAGPVVANQEEAVSSDDSLSDSGDDAVADGNATLRPLDVYPLRVRASAWVLPRHARHPS